MLASTLDMLVGMDAPPRALLARAPAAVMPAPAVLHSFFFRTGS